MMTTITRTPLQREAIEWTGTNLREIQDYMLPHSPQLFVKPADAKEFEPLNAGKATLIVTAYDAEGTARYPSLGPQFRTTEVRPGDWLFKRDGAFDVVRKAEFDAEWVRTGDEHATPAADPVP